MSLNFFTCSCICTLFQIIFINTKACNSKQDVSTMFVDSAMEFETCAIVQQSKRIFLYFIASIQLTMDYLPRALEDGIVDSLPSHGAISTVVKSP